MKMTTRNISPAQACEWLKAGEAILIDVREPDEFAAGHIACASSIPLGIVGDTLKFMDIPSGRRVIFQCLKGGRGAKACAAVEAAALPGGIFNIEGGLDGWKAAGFPVVAGAAGPTGFSIFRQVQMIVGSLVFLLVSLGFMGLTLGFIMAGILGGLLAFAGFTGWCGLAMLLERMPWNRR